MAADGKIRRERRGNGQRRKNQVTTSPRPLCCCLPSPTPRTTSWAAAVLCNTRWRLSDEVRPSHLPIPTHRLRLRHNRRRHRSSKSTISRPFFFEFQFLPKSSKHVCHGFVYCNCPVDCSNFSMRMLYHDWIWNPLYFWWFWGQPWLHLSKELLEFFMFVYCLLKCPSGLTAGRNRAFVQCSLLHFIFPYPCLKFTHLSLVDELVNLISISGLPLSFVMFLLLGFVSLPGLIFNLIGNPQLKMKIAASVVETFSLPKSSSISFAWKSHKKLVFSLVWY